MKKLLSSFSKYDLWANEALFAIVLNMTQSLQMQDIKSSFPSIHKTCLHLFDAYSIWWQRLQHTENIVVPSVVANYSTEEVIKGILAINKQWIEWLDAASESDIKTTLTYKNIKGDVFKQPVMEILLHLFNHGTYHRGQLVTMFRQVGEEEIPQTDYIFYSRVMG